MPTASTRPTRSSAARSGSTRTRWAGGRISCKSLARRGAPRRTPVSDVPPCARPDVTAARAPSAQELRRVAAAELEATAGQRHGLPAERERLHAQIVTHVCAGSARHGGACCLPVLVAFRLREPRGAAVQRAEASGRRTPDRGGRVEGFLAGVRLTFVWVLGARSIRVAVRLEMLSGLETPGALEHSCDSDFTGRNPCGQAGSGALNLSPRGFFGHRGQHTLYSCTGGRG
eukprot:4143311-Prymnesium_polylepis.1